ncbi:phage portal protein, HK97 family [Butyrivibrio sp. INlla18]|uniref:phage portal protein n=1 Tax=Butyrivibrio sp. INlla18 TaxID=1520806 RepID=UPI0008819745|nr:phage portal protein [Butyrivibrio sp. INlla18]SDA71083.1 phage portal protein, HK97 family [Butyrivibrio sp. INlla18]
MSFLDIFRPLKKSSIKRWKELGTYKATFSVFGEDIYNSSLVRACVRPLAELSSKAEAKCRDPELQRILNNRPNIYMNGKDFLQKVRTRLEILNVAFIYIERDTRGKVLGFYPVPYSFFEALEYNNGLFIKFYFSGNVESLVLPWADLAAVRKDYLKSDISGDDNQCIIQTLELMSTASQGLANSIRSTANLRGILKSTKAMLAPEAIKQQKDDFVNDYLNLENGSGIASLDSTQEFTPITINPATANAAQMKEVREDIFRFFGVNDDIVMANIKKKEQLEGFFTIRIEPFLVALSRELTSKVYGKRADDEHNILYQVDQFTFVSLDKKIQLFSTVVLYGGMTIDEWRALFNMPHIEGGDVPVRRLDAAPIDAPKDEDEDEDKEEDEDGKE